MKKTIVLALIVISLTSFAQHDEKGWKRGGIFNLSFSQLTLHNWVAGGQNSITGTSFLNLYANYKGENYTWDNTLDIGYGLIKQGKEGFIKSDDKFEVSSKYGQYAFKHWYYSGLIDFKTQFAPGYRNVNDSIKISDFLSPAVTNIALGMDFKPNDNLSVLISPLTGKFTLVLDENLSNAGAYGLEPGKTLRSELGAYVKILYKADILTNVSFHTKLDLFSNYLHKPQNIDINWENLIALKINDYLSASILFHLIYDDDILIGIDTDNDGEIDKYSPKVQLKELFGLGLMFKF
ncbi:MAG: DUF3078 domain-containing protein [Bacteroidales bacterium]|nr:DUF3078 domain-containing protein [Bacteroidales bacterium]